MAKHNDNDGASLFPKEAAKAQGPVECLGITFPNDEERRKHFLGILREKLKDPEFRKIEGFPIGEDEDILVLSDPPYYTACPNPFIADMIRHWQNQKPEIENQKSYSREPFAADVSEGKNDPIYNAHSYHTKVPHKAIMRYILHYTEPGDIVFDGFCGTGMTGVAAQMCGDKAVVESLGYRVDKDGTISQQETDENGKTVWEPFSKLGSRRAILNDLSPAATFIAYNYNTPVDVAAFEKEAKRILKEVEDECGWMYETLHVEPASSRLISDMDFVPCDPFQATEVKCHTDNLPHIQVPGATYFITFRTENFRILSPEARGLALNAIRHWDTLRWKLFSAVVMPDHIHIIAKPLPQKEQHYWDISEILHSIKSFSSNEINKVEGKVGTRVWQTESYDRIVRDSRELVNELAYMNHNPVKAGLTKRAEEYEWRFVASELEKAGWKPAPLGKINYTVWSDVFVCPECTHEVIFFDAAVNKKEGTVKNEFPCPNCKVNLTKRKMDRAWVTLFDKAINQTIRQAKQVPVLINYSVEIASSKLQRFEKEPDKGDLALIKKIENRDIPYWFPNSRMIDGGETRRNDPVGITHVHHFYTRRNLWILSSIRNRCKAGPLLLLFNSQLINISKLNRYRPGVSFPYNPLSGTMYIGSQVSESCVFTAYSNKLRRLIEAFKHIDTASSISTQSSTQPIRATADYIFIDPPFGSNLNYSELSSLWEQWLKVWTNNKLEVIENSVQGKGINEYRQLMTVCFNESYRVLKPGRWMTVEFSNTKASVWNSIQTALTEAGFIVANVSALDKQQGSFKAVTTPTAVKQDLIISAYKPNGGFEERFGKEATTEEGVWDFVRTHLKYLPVVKRGVGTHLIAVTERDPRILYDQMVAYYVRQGYPVPINSAEFQAGLAQRFSCRDGLYFLPEQAVEYDKKRMASGELKQADLFIFDEFSAIAWLRQLLKEKPQTFQDVHPQFIRELGGWQKHEKPLELSTLLEQNFLCYEGADVVPEQIHAYLSSNWKELRKLSKDDPALRAKAKDRWYVPDPGKAGDLEKLRERALLKEFWEYLPPGYKPEKPGMREGFFPELIPAQQIPKGKKMKIIRMEAVRVGFKYCWQNRDYNTIIAVAQRIPEDVLQEDSKLLMWYDQAMMRSGETEKL